MPDRLRVAVIGAGAMGRNHIRVYNELPDAELVAIADTNEGALSNSDVRGYTDYRRLLGEERLDAVSIAVPARAHHDAALACIERGIATLVEKPIAVGAEEGETLRVASERNNVPLMVGHIERFNPAVHELKERLDSGELGHVYEAHARRVGPFFPRERDIGVVHDLATHDIDVLHYLLGCDVERVHAETQRGIRTDYDDSVAAVVRYANGAIATIEANWITPVKQRDLVVLGAVGSFALDYIARTLTFIRQSDGHQTRPEPIATPNSAIEPLRAELEAFLRAARRLESPAVTAADGVAAVRVADALVYAAHTDTVVSLTGRATTT